MKMLYKRIDIYQKRKHLSSFLLHSHLYLCVCGVHAQINYMYPQMNQKSFLVGCHQKQIRKKIRDENQWFSTGDGVFPADICQHLKVFLVVTIQRMVLASSGQSPGMLLNTSQCTKETLSPIQKRFICPKTSTSEGEKAWANLTWTFDTVTQVNGEVIHDRSRGQMYY